MFEMVQELPKYDSKTWSEQMLLEKWQDVGHRVATNLQFEKIKIKKKKMQYLPNNTMKCNKIKWGMSVFTRSLVCPKKV